MFHRKIGFPQEDEILLCTVTNVQYNSVFCTLDEYVTQDGKPQSGMIHISEVSAGRIRNIREFVSEGKKIYCKVLGVDRQKGHIDLSLRRVNEGQKREKSLTLKQEQKAENIVEHLAKEQKKDPAAFYQQVAGPILEHYEYLHMAFDDVVAENASLAKLGLEPKTAKLIEDTVRERIKPKQVTIEGIFTITTYAENGVAKVRDALTKAAHVGENIDIRYLGAGNYKITITAEEFKDAEKTLKLATEAVDDSFRKVPNSTVHFERVEQT